MIKIFQDEKNSREEIFSVTEPKADVGKTVDEIIENVKNNGDKALLYYSEKFDKVKLGALKVTEEEIDAAVRSVEPRFLEILKKSAANISAFHEKQKRTGFEIKNGGRICGQKVIPLSRVGIYVPGGTAAYPSTVLMNAIPARIAGVKEIVMVSPPKSDGKIKAEVLAAARIAGVTEIYKIGGAQAIAALAFGTETVKKVNKITGPGNIFVATAKKAVFGTVDIDMIAGPSEIMIIADKTANPVYIAADLLSQAEHDKMATAILLTDDYVLAKKVQAELDVQLAALPRREIAEASVNDNGKIILVENIEKAVEIANEIAPEHLEICTENPEKVFGGIVNAGSVFIGNYTPEALGDYYAGTNHTLPTSGTAKYASPLSVEDFIKTMQYISYDKQALAEVGDDVMIFAEKEGLTAHGQSVAKRKENE